MLNLARADHILEELRGYMSHHLPLSMCSPSNAQLIQGYWDQLMVPVQQISESLKTYQLGEDDHTIMGHLLTLQKHVLNPPHLLEAPTSLMVSPRDFRVHPTENHFWETRRPGTHAADVSAELVHRQRKGARIFREKLADLLESQTRDLLDNLGKQYLFEEDDEGLQAWHDQLSRVQSMSLTNASFKSRIQDLRLKDALARERAEIGKLRTERLTLLTQAINAQISRDFQAEGDFQPFSWADMDDRLQSLELGPQLDDLYHQLWAPELLTQVDQDDPSTAPICETFELHMDRRPFGLSITPGDGGRGFVVSKVVPGSPADWSRVEVGFRGQLVGPQDIRQTPFKEIERLLKTAELPVTLILEMPI